MKIFTQQIALQTNGNPDLINITEAVEKVLHSSKFKEGNLTVFVLGSTAAITTLDYEPGLIQDLEELYEKIIPRHQGYHHDAVWGDANGFSHLRAALTKASLTVPFENGKLFLGTWQQIVLAEFDHRPRKRKIVVQVIGE
jgi:secondary thiamine-phosphate synthase enzyme